MNKFIFIFVFFLSFLFCFNSSDDFKLDLLEKTNRRIYAFNRGIDKTLIMPVSFAYTNIFPKNFNICLNNSTCCHLSLFPATNSSHSLYHDYCFICIIMYTYSYMYYNYCF